MRSICQLSLCLVLAAGTAAAQRGGGGMRGGGFGGAVRGGGGFGGGGFRGGGGYGGIRGGGFGGFRGGYGGFGRGYGGFGRGYVGNYGRFGGGRFFGRGYYSGFYGGFGFWPYFGLSYASNWPYSYYPYWPAYDYYSPYDYGYATYAPSPNVTVIYPQQSAAVGSYDQYGQPVRPAASPLYLIAFKDGTIRAAISYRVEGGTLHYVTMDHEDQEAALDTVDRPLSTELNRERRVPFSLP